MWSVGVIEELKTPYHYKTLTSELGNWINSTSFLAIWVSNVGKNSRLDKTWIWRMQLCCLKIESTHIHARGTLQRSTTHNHNCTHKVDASRLANLKLVRKKNPKTQLLIHALLVDNPIWALDANSCRSYIFPSHKHRHFRGDPFPIK